MRKLRHEPVGITLIDRRNFHLFQPLLYQVATGALSPGEIAAPLRGVFKRDQNVRVVLGAVTGFDLAGRRVLVDGLPNASETRAIPYDSLVVAGGSSYSYFDHDEWRPLAPDVKSLESALEVRRRILTAFEAAEVEPDAERRAAWLTFVVVGGGPTGVELAGQIAEIARDTLRRDFRSIDTRAARILLVEVADRVLPGFPPRLSARAARALERLGVSPLVGRKVVGIDAESVTIAAAAGEGERVPARTVIWAAGVVASELATALAAETGAELDRAGRVAVGPDLTLPAHPEVLAIGDMVQVHDARGNPVPLPGLAPVAMQQGRYAARAIHDRLHGKEPPSFRYRDKGNLATIGRASAVADIKGLQLSGLLAWLTWLFVHLFYLIGLQNRLLVFIRWTFSFVTRGRGARLITVQAIPPTTLPPVVRGAPAAQAQDEAESP
ncbi:MAG: NAD(P)/FAD-dependent oxidoreductase [Actinomycetota bacterium]|nr:NAD(P)/FAD-dependent oxidoreductase [Actinomycetota bacterium]